MREIKFRAWNKQRKEMIIVEEIHFKYNSIVYDEGIITSPMKNFEMMQFTGLKDKKGKEIYEGDVLENGFKDSKYKIIFEDGKFVADQLEGFGIFDIEDEWEVIGNIYENPELLEVEK